MTDTFNRRALLALATAVGTGAAMPSLAQHLDRAGDKHMDDMMAIPPDSPVVAMLIHPKMIALDLIGPMTVLNILRCRIDLVWKDKTPISTELGIPFTATRTFEDCPRDLDVLLVPGGILGTIDCMNDPQVMAFLADRGSRAKWVTSVCTGGLAVAAAGLLKGYDATAHWTIADLLPLMGARHVDRRVVADRNRMTCGGVTAGIDLALTLAAELRGEEAARNVQLIMEYSPMPPFRNGTPAEAGPDRVTAMRARRTWMDAQAMSAATAAGKRLGIPV
ncbi:DJ-1/PfpI family protein [Sphingomonas sp. So64.6b]|uniref:DJ-1/PfpI family protein n=1 Tax=Sphingomonas sp. So64.6b TaxID=2997354 RepID=UPI001602A9E1|nr:DJ-1/PfpI family protein [Sphingomonas sp. So64.6b]QNA85483.1 DJ-1/PfpI family protein [Sphingomonas sp. So64.6b]